MHVATPALYLTLVLLLLLLLHQLPLQVLLLRPPVSLLGIGRVVSLKGIYCCCTLELLPRIPLIVTITYWSKLETQKHSKKILSPAVGGYTSSSLNIVNL